MARGQGKQPQVFPDENVKLVINSNVFILAGESLQYKIYNHTDSGTPSTLSKMAYVALRGAQDSVVFKHKLRLEKGMAQGSFFIPSGLITGTYQLLGYTNFSLNKSVSENGIPSKSIYIINPFIAGNVAVKNEVDSTQQTLIRYDTIRDTHLISKSNLISLQTDKSSYGLRENVTFTVENGNGENGLGNYVLSVRIRLDPIQISDALERSRTYRMPDQNFFHLPELRGELIGGKVLTLSDEKPIENKTVALTIPGKNYILKMAKTDRFGRFYISIDEPYESSSAILQVVGDGKEQHKIVLDTMDFGEMASKVNNTLQLDPGLKDWLQERSTQLQIQNAYFNEENILVLEESSSTRFYGNLGRRYNLDDYTRFSSVPETFVEIITFARIRRHNGKDVFEVFDPYNPYKRGPFSSRDPLLLLDGILIQDHEEVLGYSAHDIERIHVFPGPYRYGPKVFWGIIDITSKKGDFKPRLNGEYIQEFELESPLLKRSYSSPDYSNRESYRIPDYRVQLFWEPNLDLGFEKRVQSFYTSDVPGAYQILLEGYTQEGRHVRAQKYFVVK